MSQTFILIIKNRLYLFLHPFLAFVNLIALMMILRFYCEQRAVKDFHLVISLQSKVYLYYLNLVSYVLIRYLNVIFNCIILLDIKFVITFTFAD